jgi:hypothetical protein
MSKNYKVVMLTISALLVSACASILGDKTHLMNINSNPSAANVTITDEKGSAIFTGQTPTNVTLQKSDGSYWGKKSYIVNVSKDGYATQTIPVTASANGWYIGGNIIFGGLIGWFIVDPLNGAMYNLSPEHISTSLGDKTTHNNKATDGNIAIVLLEDVPMSLRDKMVKIGK